jgi:hypothetical protein
MSSLRSLTFLLCATFAAAESIQTDLLIVGGTESGWAAAIQAARMGCKSITVVHDGPWLGGQYTEQGLVCVDESKGAGKIGWGPDWHPMKRSFHRFGLFQGADGSHRDAQHEEIRLADAGQADARPNHVSSCGSGGHFSRDASALHHQRAGGAEVESHSRRGAEIGKRSHRHDVSLGQRARLWRSKPRSPSTRVIGAMSYNSAALSLKSDPIRSRATASRMRRRTSP